MGNFLNERQGHTRLVTKFCSELILNVSAFMFWCFEIDTNTSRGLGTSQTLSFESSEA